MAGTPDRSKQQESSGGPIPEERDPRLAMARQSPERVDQATAVFSVRDVPAATESGSGSGSGSGSAENSPAGSDSDSDADASGTEDSGSASGSASESASEPGADSEPEAGSGDGTEPGSGDEAGDARLRAAVAAWVSGPRDGSADGPEAAGDGAADVAESAAEASEADEPEAADTASDAAEDDGDGDDAVADAAADSADAEATDAREGSGGDDADAESADAPEATSDDAEPADAPEAPEAEAPDADAKPSDDVKADAEPSDAAKTPADAKPSGEVKAPADAKPSDDVKADAKPSDDVKADAEPSGEVKAPADAKSADDVKADAKSADDVKADAKPSDGVKVDVKPSDDAKADAKPSDAAKAPADAKPAGGDAKPPVDQATAVFKAVKPPVDQPTQMLKSLGSKPAGAGKAESDAERTSKFVPLKGLDSGTPAKPKAQPTAPPPAKPYVGPERTTQQPLPPLPPLDLLAELTNTPPPAETPVRTAVRRVKIWTPIVLLLAVVFAVVQAVRPLPAPTLALTAKSTFAFDGDKVSLPWPAEGQGSMDVSGIGSMDRFGEQKPVPIGSVAKAMTAYVVLKDHPLQPGKDGPSIDVDAKAEKEGGYDSEGESTLNTVKEGDKLSQKDALSAIMIPSANNVARLLARWDAGSEEAFVKKMNATAKDLGMTGTTYTDPSGLKETTVSTAQDQVKLGNELVKIQALMDITKLPTWKDPSGKTWQNYNRLVPYNNAVGVKTGSTTKAGGNLLFAATKDAGGETVTVVGAILGQHRAPIIDTVNAVSKTAMLAAQDAVKASTILKKGDVVGYVDDGLGGQTPVVVTKNVSAVGWAGLTVKLELADGTKGAAIPHSAKAGTQVGELKVGDGSGGAVTVPVALQKDLAEPGFGEKLTRVG
ncbi:D-alanyl-D-alanine carboxypeptidase [Streptomyces sp. NPDC058441]|uniref:D-alanyl-D-alanine carboxypeptidase n=1 Tax=Streptomyces sp. NPDC058441 TaxID=3346502 RepID=UPI00364E1623